MEFFPQPPGYCNPGGVPLPPSPLVTRGTSVHPLPLPAAAQAPGCVHTGCHHGEGGRVALGRGGGRRVQLGPGGVGGLPDVAGVVIISELAIRQPSKNSLYTLHQFTIHCATQGAKLTHGVHDYFVWEKTYQFQPSQVWLH